MNAQDVVVAGTGAVYVAPDGTTLPADLVTPLPSGWVDVGYISEDGVQFTFSRDQEEVNAWQVSTPVRVLVTNEPITIEFELEQFDRTTVQLAFRGGTFTGTASPYTYTPPDAGASDVRALCIDAVDGTYHFRFAFPRVQISDDVAFALVRSDAVRLPLTFNVLAASVKWQIISDHPGFGAVAGLMAEQARLEGMTRDELNAEATAAGIPDPASLPNKDAVIAAIQAAQAAPVAA
jgi:hypothetical protein